MQEISAIKINEFITCHRLQILNKISIIISRRHKKLMRYEIDKLITITKFKFICKIFKYYNKLILNFYVYISMLIYP